MKGQLALRIRTSFRDDWDAAVDPDGTHDLRRHERQLSCVKPPLASWPGTSAYRPLLPLPSRCTEVRYQLLTSRSYEKPIERLLCNSRYGRT